MFSHAASTAPAMLASQRTPGHAIDAEILVVEFPLLKKLRDDSSLLVSAPKLGNEPRIADDGVDVEKRRQKIEHREENVQDWI